MKEESKYTGELKTPMRDQVEFFTEAGCYLGLLKIPDLECIKKVIGLDGREEYAKLLLLLKHYEIDISKEENPWFKLSLSLARAHVPGFQRIHKAGAKKKWDIMLRAELRIAVDDYVDERKQKGKSSSVLFACNQLAKKDPWKSIVHNKSAKPGEALRAQYNKADLRWVIILNKSKAYDLLVEGHPLDGAANK